MNLKTFFNRVWLLIAANLTSGEDLMDNQNGTSGGVIGAVEAIGQEGLRKVEAIATDVVTEAEKLVGDVKADALKAIAALGAIHNSLGAFTLSDEIIAARAFVSQAIVSVATHFAKTLG